jgi:hypothetical protein
MSTPWNNWFRQLRHDLVKRMLWPARDRRDLGGEPRHGELAVSLVDDKGTPTTVEVLWASLRATAPEPGHLALATFETALRKAEVAAQRDDVAGVLALEEAFDCLAQDLARERA